MVELCGASQWASLAFIIPKKDGCVQHITDLCLLNKAVICKQYPLPIILDMLDQISRYKFFTNVDKSMQYYKSFVSLLQCLASTNISISPWDSNAPLTLLSKSWRKFWTPAFISTMLVHYRLDRNIILYYLTKSSTGWRLMASLLIHLSVIEPFKKLTGLIIGSHPQV